MVDDEGTSPYRQGGGGPPCPECQAPMLVAPGRMSCEAGSCGEWWSKSALDPQDWRAVEIAESYRVFGAAAPEPPCPECGRGMIVSLRAEVEFAHCDTHGVWLARSQRATFDEVGGWARLLVARRSTEP